jgi:MFS family permease
MERTRQPLLTPTLKLFMFTMILANIAGQMQRTLLPLYLTELGADINNIGVFFTLAGTVPLLMQIVGGWLSDSMGRLQAIAVGSLFGVIGYGIFLIAPTWEWVLLAVMVSSLTRTLVAPSFQAFIAEQSTEETRGRVYGITETLYSLVNIIGPLLGGLISDYWGFKAMFAIGAVMYTAAALIRIGMARSATRREETPRAKPTFAGFRKSMAEMTTLLLAGGIITWIFISDGVRDIAFNMDEQFRPIYVTEVGHMTYSQIGALSAILGVAMMLVMGFGGWLSDKRGERFGITVGYLILVVGQIVFLITSTFAGFAAAWALLGIGWALISPAYSSLISKVIPQRLRGTAFGLFSTSIGVIALPAPFIGSLLWEHYGRQAPFLALPIGIMIMLPIIWIKFRLPGAAATGGGQLATGDEPPVSGAETAAK